MLETVCLNCATERRPGAAATVRHSPARPPGAITGPGAHGPVIQSTGIHGTVIHDPGVKANVPSGPAVNGRTSMTASTFSGP
jgi:hypothetical protein